MKSKLIIQLFVIVGTTQIAKAQNIINPSFDSIYIGELDRMHNWITSVSMTGNVVPGNDTVYPLTPNSTYNASGFQYSMLFNEVYWNNSTPYSSFAVSLETKPNYLKTDGSNFETFIVNGTEFKSNSQGYIDFVSCGEPFAYRPTKLKGKYQFIDSLSIIPNYGKCMVILKKFNAVGGLNDTIAFNGNTFSNFPVTNGWHDFEIPINYWSTDIPDSIVIAFFASVEPNSNARFMIDELSFDYGPLGLSPNSIDEINAFPNPVNQFIFFNNMNNDEYTYKLTGIDGTLIRTGVCVNEIFVGDLEQHFFILEIISKDGESYNFKLVKEN
ncbi:MAG: hypothetical protein AB8B74_03805 [Crocinitomicaceae bacterium]